MGSFNQLVTNIDMGRQFGNLSSAIRQFVSCGLSRLTIMTKQPRWCVDLIRTRALSKADRRG
jgi:predicted DNA-binding ribbon-helix-helix protein